MALSHELELVALSHLWLNRAMPCELLQAADGRRALSAARDGVVLRRSARAADDDRTSRGVCVEVGESVVELRAAPGEPFYHVALLVPGDRFDAALAWAAERVELLPERESGDTVFDFDVLGRARLLLPRPGGDDRGADRPPRARRGGDDRAVSGRGAARALGGRHRRRSARQTPPRSSGSSASSSGTAASRASGASRSSARRRVRSSSAGPAGPWLPTGRPAEAWPVEVIVAGAPVGEVAVGARSRVSRRGGTAAVQAS